MSMRSDLFSDWTLPEEICNGETAYVQQFLGSPGTSSFKYYAVERNRNGFIRLEASTDITQGELLSKNEVDNSLFVIIAPTIRGILYRALRNFAAHISPLL
jgi:hypothetical protein